MGKLFHGFGFTDTFVDSTPIARETKMKKQKQKHGIKIKLLYCEIVIKTERHATE